MTDFVLRHWTLAPAPGDQAPPHIHHRSDEGFIVTGGELEVLCGRERRVLAAGESLVVPAGTIHTFATHGGRPVAMIAVLTPEIDELIAALHEAGTDAVWTRYHAAMTGPAPGPRRLLLLSEAREVSGRADAGMLRSCPIPGRNLALTGIGDTMGRVDSELVKRVADSAGLAPAEAARVVQDVVAWYREPVEEYVRRRHAHLHLYGKRNPEIFALIAEELAGRVVAPPRLSERQLRRIVYG